jgi:tetratricopeptide (TPR) repeat protein
MMIMATRASLFALVALSTACVTGRAVPEPVLRVALEPTEARARAAALKDPASAAEVAWLEGNDRAFARKRLDEGLAARPNEPALLLRRAMLSASELDDRATLADLLALVRHAPESAETEIALAILTDVLGDQLHLRAEIRGALEASGLLATQLAPTVDASERAARVALASAMTSRVLGVERDEAAMRAAVTRGGWLTSWRSLGPLAPRTLRSLTTPTEAELGGIDGTPRTKLRGLDPIVRELDAWRLQVDPAAGDLPGLYVIESWFEIPAERAGAPLELELHLRESGRVSIDGTRVHEVVQGAPTARGWARVPLVLTAGWHRISVAVLASGTTRPSFSLLGSDGLPAIAGHASKPPARGLAKVPPVVGQRIVALDPARSAEALVAQLLASPEHSLFGRLVGTRLATTYWRDELDLARRLATEGAELAPRSAAMIASEARVMLRAGLPQSLSQARFGDAQALDPEGPAILATLARSIANDTPDQALAMLEKLETVAPRASDVPELRFRIYRDRGWTAEAATALRAALERSPRESVLRDAAAFHRSLLRVDEAKAFEARALELAEPTPDVGRAHAQLVAGDVDGAIASYRAASESSSGAKAPNLARISALELGRGRVDEALQAAQAAAAADPLETSALRALAIAQRAKGDSAGALATTERLRAIGATDLRIEQFRAELLGEDVGLPAKGSWLERELAIDPRALATSSEAADVRFARHKQVNLLDRIVDRVGADGHAMSLRHAVVRLQTKEATDRAGEVNLPDDALPLALRTIKASGRVIDVDRHAGKDDLSFSALAPGDAIEKKWVSIDAPVTPWGGYLRRFYFQGSVPSRRTELAVTAPKGSKMWWKGYNGAPKPTVHEEGGEVVWIFRATDVPPVEPEPGSVSIEEFLPFVVVGVDLDEETTLAANTIAAENLGYVAWDVRRQTEAVVRGLDSDREKAFAIYRFVSEEIGDGQAREPSTMLATKRGDRTGLFLSMLRAAGIDASIALARAGASPTVTPPYPSPIRFSVPLVRVPLASEVLWARMDREHTWLGKAPPELRGGEYILPNLDQTPPKPIAIADAEVDRWTLVSGVDLDVDAKGNASGTLSLELPGAYGAELREFLKSARKEDVLRALQGWVANVVPGSRLESYEAARVERPLEPLGLVMKIAVPSFMVLENGHLVSEQFFEAPIATSALGFPTLGAYLRVPSRATPLWVSELGERMTVTLRFAEGARAPVEAPRAFTKESRFGRFAQTFSWDGARRAAKLDVEHAMSAGRIPVDVFPEFRGLAQDVLQATRNRLILPIGGAPSGRPETAQARDRASPVEHAVAAP